MVKNKRQVNANLYGFAEQALRGYCFPRQAHDRTLHKRPALQSYNEIFSGTNFLMPIYV